MRGHDNDVSALAVSKDGGLIASGQLGSVLHKGFDAPSLYGMSKGGEMFTSYLASRRPLDNSITFSDDARFLAATGGDNNTFYVWDMQTGEIVASQKYLKPVTSLTWAGVDTSGRRPLYTLILATNNQVFINTLAYQVVNTAYTMNSEKCSLPASGLVREYTVACVRVDHACSSLFQA